MKIGFIGCGQMANALAQGIAKADNICHQIAGYDPNGSAIQNLGDRVRDSGVEFVPLGSNQCVVDQSDYVFLAIKPQHASAALRNIVARSETVFVSVIAGKTIEYLSGILQSRNIIRVMPNTPCLIGRGAIALSAATSVSSKQIQFVRSMLARIGTVVEIGESLMDAVTGLSGSGPAFVFTFIEAMIDAGVLNGLPRDVAGELAVQTVIGSAELVASTEQSPAVLREQVASPGGTTIHGMKQLEQSSFRAAIISAVQAATLRSLELGKK